VDFSGNDLSAADLPALTASVGLRRVKRLELSCISFGDAGAQCLAASDNLGQLQFLGLSRCRVGDPGARALAALLWSRHLFGG
jgi:hypothetical protein